MTQTVESTEPVPAELRVGTGVAADITGDAVAMAVDRGLGDQVPAQWRHLIPEQTTPAT
jgi:hypothetical protein